MRFRFIRDGARTGAMNMAVDDLFFSLCEEGTLEEAVLRIYRWEPAALSLGYHQRFEVAADPIFLAAKGIDVVRRPTGGKAVLHHEELTYSVVGSLRQGHFKDDALEDSYGKIALGLKRGLEIAGMAPELEKRDTRINVQNPAPCFLVPTRKEVLLGGKKVIGSAQKRGLSAFLQHGSIPVKMDYELLAGATRNRPEDIPAFRESFAALSEFAPGLRYDALEQALYEGFREVFGGEWREEPLTARELRDAGNIAEAKYGTEEWNLRPRKQAVSVTEV